MLIVDDEALIQLDIQDALEGGGFATATADHGQSAIALLESNQSFRALVTDIRMPGTLTGWDVTKRARELNAGMAVVYVTGDSANEWVSRGVPNSIVIQKPFASAQILTAVSQLINASNPSPPPAETA